MKRNIYVTFKEFLIVEQNVSHLHAIIQRSLSKKDV